MSGDNDALGVLEPGERGLVVGMALAGTDVQALQRLDGDDSACRTALEAVRALTRELRVALLAQEAADLSTWSPAALVVVEPSWFRDALADEPGWVQAAVAQELPPVVRARLVEALGVSLADPQALASGIALSLCRALLGPLERLAMGAEPPAVDLAQRGARLLGASLSGSPPAVIARAMASVGEPWAAEVSRSARGADPQARDDARALVARAAVQGDTPLDRLQGLALAALRTELAPSVAGALAVRLPIALGRRLL